MIAFIFATPDCRRFGVAGDEGDTEDRAWFRFYLRGCLADLAGKDADSDFSEKVVDA